MGMEEWDEGVAREVWGEVPERVEVSYMTGAVVGEVKVQLWAQVGDSAAMYRYGEVTIEATEERLTDRLTELAQELEDRLREGDA